MQMIDTVVLLLSQDSFQITDPDKFVPSHDGLQEVDQVPFTESNQSRIQLRKSCLQAYISRGSHCYRTNPRQ